MTMTRKRSPRKKRQLHGSYFIFHTHVNATTIVLVFMITCSCAMTVSYQNTSYVTNNSKQEQNVTENLESRENYTNTTELYDDIYNQPNDINFQHERDSTSTLPFEVTEPTTVEDNTTYDFVTMSSNEDHRKIKHNGNTVSDFESTTYSNDYVESIINESINLNKHSGNVNDNHYNKDESVTETRDISKDIRCNKDNNDNTKDELCFDENDKNNETGFFEEALSNREINKEFNEYSFAVVNSSDSENDLLTTTTIESFTEYDNIVNGAFLDENDHNSNIITEPNKDQYSTLRSSRKLRGGGNKIKFITKSRSYENNVIKYNSENTDSNLGETSRVINNDTICNTNCSVSNDDDKVYLKSNSFNVGSKSDILNKTKVIQTVNDTLDINNVNTLINSTNDALNATPENDGKKIATFKNQTDQPYKDEGALYAIRILAQGVLESVAERVVPIGLLDFFRRMQNQSTTLESERLRSKHENGGLGNWGRSILRSVITEPLNSLMQGVRDNGSLDSNRNFFSGVASGVAYVADSVADSFKDRVKAIYPGTLWCGDGDVARSNELGLFYLTDLCCKKHDTCKHYIGAGGTKFGLSNTGLFSRSHCNCDKAFYRCLKKTNSIISTQIGVTFFSILGPQCFKKDYPIVRCVRRTRITGQKCEEYELDKTQPKMWQWFDSPTF